MEKLQRRRANVGFYELCWLVERMGYALDRTRGSHRHFRRDGYPPINLQEGKGGSAKPYQVAQVLAIIDSTDIEID